MNLLQFIINNFVTVIPFPTILAEHSFSFRIFRSKIVEFFQKQPETEQLWAKNSGNFGTKFTCKDFG
jgi:hypothetical protein